MAFEGNEIDKKIGEHGSVVVDVTDKGIVNVSLNLEIDLLSEVEKLAKKTKTQLDDNFISIVKKLMGRE